MHVTLLVSHNGLRSESRVSRGSNPPEGGTPNYTIALVAPVVKPPSTRRIWPVM